MRRLLCLVTFAAILLNGGPAARVSAQEPPLRMIVQLNDSSIDALGAAYEQAAGADSRIWAYHSRRVVGAILELERRHGIRAHGFFTHALRGFSATMTKSQAAALASDPAVRFMEPDPLLRLAPIIPAAQIVPWGIPKIGADVSSQQSGDGTGTVSGVNVYIIDTGIDASHPDLNVVNHVTFTGDGNFDCNGHGTGVAGIVAAKDNGDFVVGVAPGAPLTGVKVMTCGGLGFTSVIIQGIDWVTANAVKPAVVNMSLGSAIPVPSLNQAVRASAQTGIFYAIAAGNGSPFTGEPLNACGTSPAGAGFDSGGVPNGIMTVAATDINDQEASFSNYGPCVDIWAPGVDITSTWLMSEGGTITGSGTSFASPYTAGAAALILSQHPTVNLRVLEGVIEAVADLPGTVSHDGATIRRLAVRLF
jgi:subtilisin family serine protease